MHKPHSMDRGLRIVGSVVLLALSIAETALDPVTRILTACLGLYGLGTGIFNYCPLAGLILRERLEKQTTAPEPNISTVSACEACTFFEGWSHRQISAYAAHADLRQYREGTAIFSAGSAIKHWHVIIEGRVEQIFSGNPQTQDAVELTTGDCFGDEAFLRAEPALYTARALSAVRILEISADSLRDLLEDDPELGARLFYSTCAGVSGRMRMLKNFFSAQPG